jgi:hypothetical protein
LLVGVGDFSADLSGSSALEASWEARLLSGLCVAPLRLGGLRGKQSTPSVWLGGTGESSTVGKQQGNGAARSTGVHCGKQQGNGMLMYLVE